MIVTNISPATIEVLKRGTFICAGDVAVNIPAEVEVRPEVLAEIQEFVRTLQIPVKEAAQTVLAALLESHGLAATESKPAVH